MNEMGQHQDENRSLSIWQRLIGTITNPRIVFADIAEHGGWGLAAVLLCGLNLVLVLLALPKIEAFTALTLAHLPTALPEAARHGAMVAATVSAVVLSVLGPLFTWLVITFVIWIFSLFTGQRVHFGTLYAITVFAWVPATIGIILKYILILIRPVSAMASTSVSLGAFFPANSSGVLYRIFQQISPFGLWSLVLLALGAALALKTGFGKTLTFLLVCWVVVILVLAFAFPTVKGFGA